MRKINLILIITIVSSLAIIISSAPVAAQSDNLTNTQDISYNNSPQHANGEKIDPKIKGFINLTKIDVSNNKVNSDRNANTNKIKTLYGIDDLSRVDILVNISVDRDRILNNKDISNYEEASTVISSDPTVKSKIERISNTADVPVENVDYILFDNSIVVEDARTQNIPDIATKDSVQYINNLEIPLESTNKNTNVSHINNSRRSDINLPNQPDPRVYNGPSGYQTTEESGIATEKVTKNAKLTGEGVKIGVFDTGANHTDVNDNIAGFQDTTDGIDDNDDTRMDYGEHGTFVSGSVVQSAPESDLYIAATENYRTSEYILALEWFLENDVDIISLSFGRTSLASQPGDGSSLLAKVTNRAVDGRFGTGIGQQPQPLQDISDTSASPVVFVSAGNSGEEHVSGQLSSNSDSDTFSTSMYRDDEVILYWDESKNANPDITVTAPDGTDFTPSRGRCSDKD
jgi:hypothetical protein